MGREAFESDPREHPHPATLSWDSRWDWAVDLENIFPHLPLPARLIKRRGGSLPGADTTFRSSCRGGAGVLLGS